MHENPVSIGDSTASAHDPDHVDEPRPAWLDSELLDRLLDNRDEPVSATEALRDGWGGEA